MVKVNINQIPPEGLTLKEDITPLALELETDTVKFGGPVKIEAEIFKITNVVTVDMVLTHSMLMNCSRCLNEFEISLQKNLKLNYPIDKSDLVIDLCPDIREEIILGYPIKPLCSPSCKGLCPKCGKNLNEGGCSCGPT